jgi:hypothetical protein
LTTRRQHARAQSRNEQLRARPVRAILGSKLVLDLDGNTVALGSGSNVVAWADLSGRGNSPTQLTVSKQPQQVLNALDGNAALSFNDAAPSFLGFDASFTGLPAASYYRTYVIGSMSDISNNRTFVNFGANATANTGVRLYYSLGPTAFRCGVSTPANYAEYTVAQGFAAWSSFKLVDGDYTATGIKLRIQNMPVGTDFATAPLSLGAQTYLRVGIFNDNVTAPLRGQIARIIVALTPTAAEHAELIQHLKWKYPSLGLA